MVIEKKEWKINVQAIRNKIVLNEVLKELERGKNGKRNSLIFKIGLTTGLRISDIVTIKIKDVKGKTEFELVEQKTTKKRKVYLNNVLTELTEYLSLNIDSEWLFPNSWDSSRHVSTNQFYKIVSKIGDNLGLDYLGTHTMRKTFGYFYYKKTKDVATLMEIFNHSNQKITLKYIGITDEEIKNSLKDFKIFD